MDVHYGIHLLLHTLHSMNLGNSIKRLQGRLFTQLKRGNSYRLPYWHSKLRDILKKM
jgi:hypothetical protein